MYRHLIVKIIFIMICVLGYFSTEGKAAVDQPGKKAETPENSDEKSPATDAKFENNAAATVIKRIRELHGDVEYDAKGKVIGIDLLDRQAERSGCENIHCLAGIAKIIVVGRKDHRSRRGPTGSLFPTQ